MTDPRSHLAGRTLNLSGVLDSAKAGEVSLGLMYLDGSGDDAVTLLLNGEGDDVAPALWVMDTISLLGVPVDTLCVGRVRGTVLGVLAAGRKRLATPHARLGFGRHPGTAPDLSSANYVRGIAEILEMQQVEFQELERRDVWWSASEALTNGLLTDVLAPS